MKRLLLLFALLWVGTTGFSAVKADKAEKAEKADKTEQTDEASEEKHLTDEERTKMIHKALREREVELVIDPWGGSGVECKELVKTNNGFDAYTDKPERFFERGYTFKPINFMQGYRYVFEHEGKYYGVKMSEVQFDRRKDAKELDFMIRGDSKQLREFGGRFYGTSRALWLMLIVMGAAALVAVLYLFAGMESLRPLLLAILPAAILIFSLIEIFGYIKFGTDMFWWCEYERYGFFGSLFRLFPFAAMVAAQVASLRIYGRVLFKDEIDEETGKPKQISLKPAAWSLALCVPVFVICIFIVAGAGMGNTILMDIVGLVSFLGTLGVGLIISLRRNVKSFGATTGLYVTIFSIVYIIGCIISAIAMIILVFQIIFQILVVVGTILIFMMMGTRRRVYRNGRVYEEIHY